MYVIAHLRNGYFSVSVCYFSQVNHERLKEAFHGNNYNISNVENIGGRQNIINHIRGVVWFGLAAII